MNELEFQNILKEKGIEVSEHQLQQFQKYYEILVEWNEKMNLTAITDKEDVYLKHFYDSLTLSKVYDLSKANNLCDIGTGAGFPGLILKIFYPNLEITLVDSLLKRVNYLNKLIEKLQLTGIKAYHIRAEDLIRDGKKFDIVTARAVASLPKLLPWTVPLVNQTGSFLAMKGNVEEELEQSKTMMKKYNWYVNKKEIFTLPNKEDIRTILEIKNKA